MNGPEAPKTLAAAVRAPLLAAIATASLFLAGFGLWGGTAEVAEAVVAPGVIKTRAPNHVVRHRTGGLVAGLNVREGQKVRKGDMLLRLDVSEFKARLAEARTNHTALQAERQRLKAEEADANLLVFPPPLRAGAAAIGASAILRREQNRFASNLREARAAHALSEARLAGLQETIARVKARIAAHRLEQDVAAARLKTADRLHRKGYASLKDVQALQQSRARAQAQIEEVRTLLSTYHKELKEVRLNRDVERAGRRKRILDRLTEVETL